MPNVKNNAAAQETRRRLIDAAGAVFAERGLHAATTKEITDRAGVNAAAINYHFSDKFALYAAVIRYALSLTPIALPAERLTGSPEECLRAHITALFDDLYARSRPAWRATLLAHEFAQPTAALDAVVDELIRPRTRFLHQVVRDILGPGASEQQVVRASLSIGAQCFLYLYQAELVRRLYPDLLGENRSREMGAHIAEFSLGALRAMRRQQAPARQRRRSRRITAAS